MKTTQPKQVAPSRAIRIPEVCGLIGASRATVWRKVKDGSGFPKPFHISESITVWDEREILEFIAAKKAERGAK